MLLDAPLRTTRTLLIGLALVAGLAAIVTIAALLVATALADQGNDGGGGK